MTLTHLAVSSPAYASSCIDHRSPVTSALRVGGYQPSLEHAVDPPLKSQSLVVAGDHRTHPANRCLAVSGPPCYVSTPRTPVHYLLNDISHSLLPIGCVHLTIGRILSFCRRATHFAPCSQRLHSSCTSCYLPFFRPLVIFPSPIRYTVATSTTFCLLCFSYR